MLFWETVRKNLVDFNWLFAMSFVWSSVNRFSIFLFMLLCKFLFSYYWICIMKWKSNNKSFAAKIELSLRFSPTSTRFEFRISTCVKALANIPILAEPSTYTEYFKPEQREKKNSTRHMCLWTYMFKYNRIQKPLTMFI